MKWFRWRETKWGAYTFAACTAVLLYVILQHIGTILHGIGSFIGFFTPVIYGLILAYIMDFLVKFLQKKCFHQMEPKKGRFVSVVVTTLIVVGLLLLMFFTLVPQLVTSITDFVTNWDSYAKSLSHTLSDLPFFKGKSSSSQDVTQGMEKIMTKVSDYLSKNSDSIIQTLSSIGSTLATWLIAFIVAIYILLAKEDLIRGMKKLGQLISGKRKLNLDQIRRNEALSRINEIFSKYIVCEIVDAFIVGCSNAVFMLIAGMPYVALISVEVGVTNLAPTFGPIVGAVIGAFILLLVKPAAMIPFLIFTVILQTIDGYVIKPKMYGGALSVPSVWILVSIIVLGRMFGVVGILLAIPVAAIITYWLREMMSRKEQEGTDPDDGAEPEGATTTK